jgi:protein-S-isoprenylcysteine O-methyltransferase Ste14
MRKRVKKVKIKFEIDYDKLAKSIIKANMIAAASEQKEQPDLHKPGIIGLLKMTWVNLFRSNNAGDKYIKIWFVTLTGAIFLFISIVGVLAGVIIVAVILYIWKDLNWVGTYQIVRNVLYLGMYALFVCMLFIFSFLSLGASKEVAKLKDSNFVLLIFSNLTSLTALTIAIITLYLYRSMQQ